MTRATSYRRRGVAAVVMVVVLIVIALMVAGLVLTGGGSAELALRRAETVQSFYAAEAGMNMAIREVMIGSDEDGDGAIGSISDDGNDANDPAVGPGRVRVTRTVVGPTVTLTSLGYSGASQREIEAIID